MTISRRSFLGRATLFVAGALAGAEVIPALGRFAVAPRQRLLRTLGPSLEVIAYPDSHSYRITHWGEGQLSISEDGGPWRPVPSEGVSVVARSPNDRVITVKAVAGGQVIADTVVVPARP